MISKIDKYRFQSMPVEKINAAFTMACSDGNIELVKYLLFDKGICNAEIEKCGGRGILNACNGKNNDIVKFLLEGKELQKHVSINVSRGSLLGITVKTHNKELLNYLLDKDSKVNLNQNNDEIFKGLMQDFHYNKEMIMSLIVDYELPKTQEIIDFLDEKNRNVEQKKMVNSWFEVREMVETMQYVFTEDAKKEPKIKQKKMKI